MSDKRPFSHLVVVGSSAGGVEALSEFVSTLPEDFPAPIVAAQHLDPARESRLREILDRKSTLPVRTLGEHESLPLEGGTVFVVPSDRHVSVTDSEVFLQEDHHGRPKPSIDLVFTTAAEVYGDRLIAVVLTGTGNDGARAVKKAGGTVVVQNPETAAHSGMPRSLAPNTVDIVADLESIGPILHELLVGLVVPGDPDEKRQVREFLEEVRGSSGIDFRSYKTPTILRRLQRRVVATGSGDLEGYQRYLHDHPEEYQQLVNSFLIKVTEFFRDRDLYGNLRDEVIPELVEKARREGDQIRIWSAGCATGEETYSLAILVSEALGEDSERVDVRIFGTDIDAAAVEFARRGFYSQAALEGLPEGLVEKYFTYDAGVYQVKKQIRGMIVFGQHDLAQRASFPRTDLVMCRNVLIYFTQELQRRALQLFAYSLKDKGYLVLGKSETTSPLGEYFEPHGKGLKVFRRLGDRFSMPPVSTSHPTPLARGRTEPALRPAVSPRAARKPKEGAATVVAEGFLARFPVGVVVVDRRYDIRSINAAARRLLGIRDPAVGEDFLHAVRGAHYAELREALDAAFRGDRPAPVDRFDAEEVTTGETRHLRLVCYPQKGDGAKGAVESVMVVAEDVTDLTRSNLRLEEQVAELRAGLEKAESEAREERERHEAVNRRLVEANRQLTEANAELVSLNEEIQSTNEQYLVANEEAQAATEEVETLNEEFQATNEELETLNEELHATIEELNTTNEDLHARSQEMQDYTREGEERREALRSLLESLPDAVLAISEVGEVVFVNEAFERTFGLMDEGEDIPANLALRDGSAASIPRDKTPWARASRGESFVMGFTAEGAEGSEHRFVATGRPLIQGPRRGGVLVVREMETRKAETRKAETHKAEADEARQ